MSDLFPTEKMNRIDLTFKELKSSCRKAFMPFITAGDPDLATSIRLLKAAQDAGASLVELGIPFSDPIADGPVIQNSFTRALDKGITLDAITKILKPARKKISIPVVAMLSFSIVYRFGAKRFIERAKQGGFDGAIIPDLPVEEADEICAEAAKGDFKIVSLIAPNTPLKRRKKIAAISTGFLYYMSVVGITGMRDRLPSQLTRDVRQLKRLTALPVCVGFGIKGPQLARMVAEVADGVIVGSALVKIVEKFGKNKKRLLSEAGRFMSSICRAISE